VRDWILRVGYGGQAPRTLRCRQACTVRQEKLTKTSTMALAGGRIKRCSGATRACAASWPHCAAQPPSSRAIITTAPGEEAQVAYGDGPMADPDVR
jgi:hypothetical protein